MQIKILLGLFAVGTKEEPGLNILLDNGFPSADWETSCFDTATKLLEEYTGWKVNRETAWINLQQYELIETPDCLTIPYLVIVPKDEPLKKGSWVNYYDMVDNPEYAEIISLVSILSDKIINDFSKNYLRQH